MALGDVTYDEGSPTRVGNLWQLTGTVEADATDRAFRILGTATTASKGRLVSFVATAEDGVLATRVRLNQIVNGGTQMGTVSVDHGGTGTVRYVALYT